MNKESHSSISCKHRTKRKLQSPKRHQSPDLHILQCTAVTLTYRKLIVSLNIYQVHIWQAYYILLRSSIWEALRCMLQPTASPSRGWVPETSRSYHYWQPAPGWRLLPWLANPGNPAMSPHPGKWKRHPSHWINNGKREGRDGENCPDNELPLQTTLKVHAKSTCNKSSDKEHMEF